MTYSMPVDFVRGAADVYLIVFSKPPAEGKKALEYRGIKLLALPDAAGNLFRTE